jgi:hypothetical protein
MCRIASLFLLKRLKGSMSGNARDFNNIETLAVIKSPPPSRQGAEANSRHSDRNIRGTYRRLSGPQDRFGRVKKISPPTGIRSPYLPARSVSLYRLSW